MKLKHVMSHQICIFMWCSATHWFWSNIFFFFLSCLFSLPTTFFQVRVQWFSVWLYYSQVKNPNELVCPTIHGQLKKIACLSVHMGWFLPGECWLLQHWCHLFGHQLTLGVEFVKQFPHWCQGDVLGMLVCINRMRAMVYLFKMICKQP